VHATSSPSADCGRNREAKCRLPAFYLNQLLAEKRLTFIVCNASRTNSVE
jgi:hypothetical protein